MKKILFLILVLFVTLNSNLYAKALPVAEPEGEPTSVIEPLQFIVYGDVTQKEKIEIDEFWWNGEQMDLTGKWEDFFSAYMFDNTKIYEKDNTYLIKKLGYEDAEGTYTFTEVFNGYSFSVVMTKSPTINEPLMLIVNTEESALEKIEIDEFWWNGTQIDLTDNFDSERGYFFLSVDINLSGNSYRVVKSGFEDYEGTYTPAEGGNGHTVLITLTKSSTNTKPVVLVVYSEESATEKIEVDEFWWNGEQVDLTDAWDGGVSGYSLNLLVETNNTYRIVKSGYYEYQGSYIPTGNSHILSVQITPDPYRIIILSVSSTEDFMTKLEIDEFWWNGEKVDLTDAWETWISGYFLSLKVKSSNTYKIVKSGYRVYEGTYISENSDVISVQIEKIDNESLIVLESFVINNDDYVTYSATVEIDYTLSEGSGEPTHYRIAGDEQFTGATWLPVNGKITYTFTGTGMEQILYLQLKNNHTLPSEILSDEIFFKAIPEKLIVSDFSLNGGEINTTKRLVTLSNEVTNGKAISYSVAENPEEIGKEWYAYVETPEYELSGGKGLKTVYFAVSDGVEISETVSATIWLDESETVKSNGMSAKLYPNPVVDNTLYIALEEQETQPVKVTVYSLTGQTYLTALYEGQEFPVDLTNIPNGILLVKISQGDHYVVKRIIKK